MPTCAQGGWWVQSWALDGALEPAGQRLTERRDVRFVRYGAAPQGLEPLADRMAIYGVFWRERFDRLEDLLNRMDQ